MFQAQWHISFIDCHPEQLPVTLHLLKMGNAECSKTFKIDKPNHHTATAPHKLGSVQTSTDHSVDVTIDEKSDNANRTASPFSSNDDMVDREPLPYG